VELQDHRLLLRAEEVEELLSVHLDAVEGLAVNGGRA
jgi:hypothetical protein